MKKICRNFLALFTLLLLMIMQLSPVLSAADAGKKYVHEEAFPSDYNMTGLMDSVSVAFNVGKWTLNDAVLTLCFSVTPLLHYEVSNLSVSLNGERFTSFRLPVTAGQAQQTQIKIPVDLIKEGSNQLKLESYIRTNDAEPCSDDISKASWMTVLKDSSVSISYTPTAKCESIADCYNQFTSIEALENDESAVFIRAGADETELTVAAATLSGIAGNAILSYEKFGLSAKVDEKTLKTKKYALYISKYNSLLPAVQKLLSQEQIQQVKNGNAILALVKLSDTCNVLVLTGDNDSALQNAGRLLGNQKYMQQTKAPWRMVSADENVMLSYNEQSAIRPLTDSGSYVNGPFRQNAEFYVESFPNRVLASGSAVKIKFRYSENLDFNRSLITVYVNNTPIGSKKLTKELAKEDSVSFSIPADLDIKGNFVVTAAFDLEIPDLWCTMRQDEMPWAFISNESTISIITDEASSLLFEYYPSPFVQNGHMNNVVVILPVQPSEADLEALRATMLTLGRFQKDNTGNLRVTLASAIGNLRNANVIDIGRLEKNSIVKQLNGQLYFQFSPKGTTIRSNEKMLIEPNYGATLGTLQLLYSPYSADKRALMIISGVTDKAMLNAVRYVGLTDNVWKIYGDGFVADSTTVHPFRFKPDNAKELLPGIEQLELLPITLVGAGVLVLLIIAALLLIRKYRRQK